MIGANSIRHYLSTVLLSTTLQTLSTNHQRKQVGRIEFTITRSLGNLCRHTCPGFTQPSLQFLLQTSR